MKVCVIPARGGSKRIPRKNILEFCGRPMIAYAIDAAKDSTLFDHIIVSTDDDEIAQISRDCGAGTPFRRPVELADDFTPTAHVIAHAIAEVEKLGWYVDVVCCIYPCAPLIQVPHICTALDLFVRTSASYCFPVARFPSSVQRALKRSAEGRMTPMFPDHVMDRSQDVEQTYYDAGQFYWGSKNAWESLSEIHAHGVGLVIPRWCAVDIDTPEDWEVAEMMYQIRRMRND